MSVLTRSKERNDKKKKKRKGRSGSGMNEKTDSEIGQKRGQEIDPMMKSKEDLDHGKQGQDNIRENGIVSKADSFESPAKEEKQRLNVEKNGEREDCSGANEGGIIVSKIADIPTRPEWFERQTKTLTSRAFREVKVVETKKIDNNSSKLKFEFHIPAKRLALKTNPAASTFAELSNKLKPTQSLSSRKLPAFQPSPKPPPEVKQAVLKPNNPIIVKNGVEPESQNESDALPDIVHIKDVNGNKSKRKVESRSRSRSWSGSGNGGGRRGSRSDSGSRSSTYSRSRSRTRSYTYSRSRSRSYSYSSYYSRSASRSPSYYSRSRSRSYYSSYSSRSRSRSRTRSPSIVRRRGSPSFLDKRRITSARKRPVPYHRPTPSPSPSSSSSRDSTRTPSPTRAKQQRAESRK